MSLVKKRVGEASLLSLINRFLKSGAMEGEHFSPSEEGTPQGGPLSPLLANLLLDELDRELERRGHKFVRYADDCNIYVKSKRAGERVLASLSKFLCRKLKLTVNFSKSAVDRPWKRKFLGFTFTSKPSFRRKVSEQSLIRFKDKIRLLTRRTRGNTITTIIDELKNYLIGWKAYYGFSEVPSPLRDLDKWIRRRLRCYLWKQWGRRGYRELVKRGVSRQLAWNTSKSAHGPWRLSRSPGLAFALTEKYFSALGLPLLINRQKSLNQPNRRDT